jgi:hypothetical protein
LRFRTTGRSRGGTVLVAALAIDSLGNGLFMPLWLVYFVELTDVPLGLVGVLLSVASVGGVLLLKRRLRVAALRDREAASVT